MIDIDYQIFSEKVLFQGKIIEVIERQLKVGDKELSFELARRSPGTRLIIPTPEDGFIMAREFRSEHETYDYRLPGGKVFDRLTDYNAFLKSGEDILEKAKAAAIKEAVEEVGIRVKDLEYFAVSKCGATIIWDLFFFLVNTYENIPGGQTLEHGENIDLLEVSRDEARTICLDGRMQEDRSAVLFLRYL